MAKTLIIQLSEDLERKLAPQAEKLNLSLENLILQSLEQSVSQLELDQDDPGLFHSRLRLGRVKASKV